MSVKKKLISQIWVTQPLPESESLFSVIAYKAWWGPFSAWLYSKPTKTLLLFLVNYTKERADVSLENYLCVY